MMSTSSRRSLRRARPRHDYSPAYLIPLLISIALLPLLHSLLSLRRRFTATPQYHYCLLLRIPGTPLDSPANRIFNVRADRNILSTGLLAHCHFEAEILRGSEKRVACVPRGMMKRFLRGCMRIKREVDEELAVASPLEKRKEVVDEDGDVVPGGGRVAEGVAKEWVRRVEEALEGRRKREGAGSGAEGRPDEVEVWRVVVKNWTEGWVVEPFHRSWKSLSDDDEMAFTWTNSRRSDFQDFTGQWPGRSCTISLA